MVFPIRRIGEDQIVGRRVAFEEGCDFRFHGAAAIEAGFGEVFADHRTGLPVFVHKHAGRRAAAERFEADGSGTGEQIQNTGVFHALAEDRKDRLAHEISGRPRHGGRDLDGDAPGASGDDSHARCLAGRDGFHKSAAGNSKKKYREAAKGRKEEFQETLCVSFATFAALRLCGSKNPYPGCDCPRRKFPHPGIAMAGGWLYDMATRCPLEPLEKSAPP